MNKKHGIPGIGITGLAALDGKSGNSIYFEYLDNLFIYIGDDYLKTIIKDYDDIDYDITYAENEKRLDPKYNTNDIIYIKEDLEDSDKTIIKYMVEMTDDLTTCTKEYFLRHIKYIEPFTIKQTINGNIYLYPFNIANPSLQSRFNMNSIYYNSLLSINSYENNKPNINKTIIDNSSIYMDASTYYDIPYMYFNNYKKSQIINTGAQYEKYDYEYNNSSVNLITLNANRFTGTTKIDNQFNIKAVQSDSIQFIVNKVDDTVVNKLYIDNLYLKKNNLGNIETQNVLFNPELCLDNDGHCYTLTDNDYNSSTQSFNSNINKFFNDNKVLDNYHYGYIHTYWNYNDNTSSNNIYNYYQPNYIRSNFTEEKRVYHIVTDEYGNFVRDWNYANLSNIDSEEIRNLLINTIDQLTLNDVSNNLDEETRNYKASQYLKHKGLIKTQDIRTEVPYISIKTLDNVEYIQYTSHIDLVYQIISNIPEADINPHIFGNSNSTIYGSSIGPNIGGGSAIHEPINPPGKVDPEVPYYSYSIIINNKLILADGSTILNPDIETINKYIDTSYYSGIDYIYDNNYISDIKLSEKLDPTGKPYRYHDILQWITTPDGLKHYSKHTYANYNYQTNQYNIDSTWLNTNGKKTYSNVEQLPEIFNITIDKTNNKVIIDSLNNGKQNYISDVSLIENDILLDCINNNNGIYEYTSNILTTLPIDDIKQKLDEPDDISILNQLHLNLIKNQSNDYITYNIKYKNIGDNSETYHINTQKLYVNGYKEYRTLPIINLKTYNDIESLEKLNNKDNGILCNQFQYFINIDVDNFDNTNWGQLYDYIGDSSLSFELTTDLYLHTLDDNLEFMSLNMSIIKPGIDIFNVTSKQLEDKSNIVDSSIILLDSSKITIKRTYTFSISELYFGNYKLRFNYTTDNPEPVYINSHTYVSKLQVNTANKVYKLDDNYLVNMNSYLYDSEYLKGVIMPISYTASYNQNTLEKVGYINDKLSGPIDNINIVIYPYKFEDVISKYVYGYKPDNLPNWNAFKFKRRYLQDNITTLNIEPININNILDLIPVNEKYNNYLAEDIDDIYDTYLEVIYNKDLYDSKLYDDEEQFIYNGMYYLSSQYDQFKNNTAVFIHQNYELPLRSHLLLNTLKAWNKEYLNYKYESDNPFPGHNELYGNGYQYLPSYADNGQYISENLFNLDDLKVVSNEYIFDKNKLYYSKDINKPIKEDIYTPITLFRTLLYNLKWVYPKYYSQNGVNLIQEYNIVNKKLDNCNDYEIPYNLTYSLYPRIMFNDEEQVNIIMMLRCPTIEEENKYQLENNDILLNKNIVIENLENPINVLN